MMRKIFSDWGEHPGYVGLFTRNQEKGALENGCRVSKINSVPGDAHPNGSEAVVLGSVGHPSAGVVYFVEWDATPGVAVGVAAHRITPINEGAVQ